MAILSQINHCESGEETGNCFKVLSEQEMTLLENNRTEIKFNKGETIIKQGTKSSDILYLKSGLVKMSINNGDNNLILCIKTKNHFLGTENIYGHEYHPYTVTAIEDSVICFIDTSAIRQLIKQNNNFNAELYTIITNNSLITYDRFFSLTQKQLHGRFADILLCLSKKVFKANAFDLPLSRKDLAALTGMAPESVIRIIKDFKTDKIIHTKGKHIEILNEPLLRKISNVG
jgi:CRP-like cAMP-binding protein